MAPPTEDALSTARAHELAGRPAAAQQIYADVLASDPDQPIALWRVAEHDLANGRVPAAVARLERALSAASRRGIARRELLFALGRAHMARPSPAEAKAVFLRMLEEAPGDVTAMMGAASAALADGDAMGAERLLRDAVAEHPRMPGVWANLAVALAGCQRLDDALECATRAVELAPDSIAACQVLSAVAIQCGKAAAAIPACRAALARAPASPALAAALADALKANGARVEARALLAPLAAAPRPHPGVLVSFGALCIESGHNAEAVRVLEQAIAIDPRDARAWDNLGAARKRNGEFELAAPAFAQALALAPALAPPLCNLIETLRALCDWDRLEDAERRGRERHASDRDDMRWDPFVALRDDASPRALLEVARTWSARTLPRVAEASPAIVRGRGTRLRVGYLSADLQDHATARLMAGLFERHDRSRFEIFAYSYGRDDGSALRARLRTAIEHWRDCEQLDDAESARRIAADGIDVLVELKGHTRDNRLAILARRPAPVQVHYLGFPGTLGFDAVTYFIADSVTLPAGDERAFHEIVLRMPRCYQVNDDRRPLPAAAARRELGLPDDAIVLAQFNQTYKLSRRFFAIWADAMRSAPDSILWLCAPHEATRANLRREAELAGLDAARLVFAPAVGHDAHIARLRAADLALDLLPYGSHTTGSDALWAGLPMLSCRGETFAGRVGASLLAAVELPDLVTASIEAYGDALRALVRDRGRLNEYRRHLEAGRTRFPLFDTGTFTRDFERLLEHAAAGS